MDLDGIIALLVERATGKVVDRAVAAAVDRVWAVVGAKVGGHPAIAGLHDARSGPQQRAEAAQVLRQAELHDKRFAHELRESAQAAALAVARAGGGSVVANHGGNVIGDVHTTGAVSIKQRVVNYAERHPGRFAVVVLVALVVVVLAGYGGFRGVRYVAGFDGTTATTNVTTTGTTETAAEPQVTVEFTVDVVAVSMVFSPDSKALAIGGYRSGVSINDPATGTVIATLPAEGGTWLSFSPDGRSLLASGTEGNTAVWQTSGSQQTPLFRIPVDSNQGTVASMIPGTSLVATLAGGLDGCSAQFWDPGTGAQTSTLPLGESCGGIAFSPDGGDFATFADGSATVELWERSTGRNTARFQANDYVRAAAYSPTGQFLATASGDAFTLWKPRTGEKVISIDTGQPVTCFAFSHDGNLLASGGKDGRVRVWDLITRRQVAEFARHTDDDGVSAVAFSPDGSLVATSDSNGEVKVWKGVG